MKHKYTEMHGAQLLDPQQESVPLRLSVRAGPYCHLLLFCSLVTSFCYLLLLSLSFCFSSPDHSFFL